MATSETVNQSAREFLKCAFISVLAIASISSVVERCDKSSQKRDIKRAIEMARAFDKE
jgi:hypothetical protein